MKMENDQWLAPDARTALNNWVDRYRNHWESEGADAEEVRNDLENHLWMEHQSADGPVSLREVRFAVDQMGLPAMAVPAVKAETSSGFTGMIGSCFKSASSSRFSLFLWPLLVVLWELLTNTLADMFFDPISRTSQGILLVSVAAIGAWCYFRADREKIPAWLGFLSGAGVVVSLYWGFLLVPVIIVGTLGYGFGVVFSAGIGLLFFPIYFLCVYVAAAPLLLCRGLWRNRKLLEKRSAWYGGLVFGLLALLFVEGTAYVTRYGVEHDKVSLIREFGSEESLLDLAFESRKDTTFFLTGIDELSFDDGWKRKPVNRTKAREIYYRVTGKSAQAASSEEPLYLRRRARFDRGLGGDSVATEVKDLGLASSRLDGHVDAASRLGYWEWTMEFSNESRAQQEARMQILLPNEAVVSRLTLWVNGEPEEAAFAATAKVTTAYKTIAVRERRDPVLVRWIGADRIMAQCFPVPAGGKMKIRIGVTAPLDQNGRLFLPRIIEKNFGIEDDLNTSVWVQGDCEMAMDELEGKGAQGRWRQTNGTLSTSGLMSRHSHVQCFPTEQASQIWTHDPFADEIIMATREFREATFKKEKIAIVVDGSAYFSEWAEAADRTIAKLREKGHEVTLFVAIEEEVQQGDLTLSEMSFVGGQDCIAALEAGMQSGAKKLFWMHGSQPISFPDKERFLQLLERGFQSAEFHLVDLVGGPNRLLEDVAKSLTVSGNVRPAESAELEAEMLRLVSGETSTWRLETIAEAPEGAVKVWDHLARWNVWQQVKKAALAGDDRNELAKLAAKYQLVTPVSGAVVLETKAQYKRFGLDQVDGNTPSVPSIPEPSTALLSLLASLMVWRRRRIIH